MVEVAGIETLKLSENRPIRDIRNKFAFEAEFVYSTRMSSLNSSISDWINAASTVTASFMAYNALQLSRRVEDQNRPILKASAIAWNCKYEYQSVVTDLELSLVNEGKVPCWISEINWKDADEDSRSLDLVGPEVLILPFKLDAGEYKKLTWQVIVAREIVSPERTSGDSDLVRSLIDNGDIDDFEAWELAIHPAIGAPEFVYVFNGDFRSAKAYPRYSKELHFDQSSFRVGIKNWPKMIRRNFPVFKTWFQAQLSRLWHGSGDFY